MGEVKMRFLLVAFCAVLAASAASAETAPPGKHILAGNTIAAVPHAAWDEGGKIRTASGDALAKAPANAVRYEMKTVIWPTGTVKVLTFKKDAGGVLHALTDEIQLYVMAGAAEVGVGGKPT